MLFPSISPSPQSLLSQRRWRNYKQISHQLTLRNCLCSKSYEDGCGKKVLCDGEIIRRYAPRMLETLRRRATPLVFFTNDRRDQCDWLFMQVFPSECAVCWWRTQTRLHASDPIDSKCGYWMFISACYRIFSHCRVGVGRMNLHLRALEIRSIRGETATK